ncbi:hypothetical protein Daura_19300 [Dactylosporangium aurantiacum]|uniref:Uncharacterized protein n=1 Tax=Dactylosporangium aurantiacum TaxID=35754 RepID=A0A9Q9ISD3_9ACTN|nr:hypothetical protein [Dactylosporangium aurantiacum]MDG6110352.1 hypothetical protein [Dactylosporangium aurantiacum]UWZ58123.1 hypothetical protein Daura_19300 [Dactylosporangium aurantiacum]
MIHATSRPGDVPFEVSPDAVDVWVEGGSAAVTDLEGNELHCGHQRPVPTPPAPAPGSTRYRLSGPAGGPALVAAVGTRRGGGPMLQR